MKLYYAPGACSLASRISIHEAGLTADFEGVDLKAKVTGQGSDYKAINPKGSVPMLVLDDGETVTENVAILDLIADREPELRPGGILGRTRLIEMLAYLSSELHVAFKPFFWKDSSDGEKTKAGDALATRFAFLESQLDEPWLFGRTFTVADAYLFVMLRWAKGFGLTLPTRLSSYFDRVGRRDHVRRALAEEGLIEETPAEETLA